MPNEFAAGLLVQYELSVSNPSCSAAEHYGLPWVSRIHPKENMMRIAQVAPLWEQVPPPAYGGVELVVSLLTEELIHRGHEVTLFASGDSSSFAKIESVHSQALRLDPIVKEPSVYETLQLMQVYEQAHKFDVIHSHVGYPAPPFNTGSPENAGEVLVEQVKMLGEQLLNASLAQTKQTATSLGIHP